MERNRFKYCELKAYYGGLLTDKQSEIFTLHYEEDYSLAEIAEKFNITRQAVLDAINGWDPTGEAIYYFNPNTATNKWIWSRPQIKQIGKHIFCK